MTATAQPDHVQHAEFFQLQHPDGSVFGAVHRLTDDLADSEPVHHLELAARAYSQSELYHLGERLIAVSAAPSARPSAITGTPQ